MMKRLFGCALSLMLMANAALATDVKQKDIEPVFVQLEQNAKEFPMIVEKDGKKYQVYRAQGEKETESNYYYSDKEGVSHWISEDASHNFTVGYLDGEKLVSLDKVSKDASSHLANLKKEGKVDNEKSAQSQLVHLFRRYGYGYGYYGYRGYRYVGYRYTAPYYYGNYYRNNVVYYHSYPSYTYQSYGNYYYNSGSYYYNSYAPVNVSYGYYYGPRYTVCLWS
ncbi:MAG: hypothetical protein H6617_10745 [Bdellovibrionaceae bacterium]|nr:hypothetical protein [Pseudobdellovibrionaceae bacterium]